MFGHWTTAGLWRDFRGVVELWQGSTAGVWGEYIYKVYIFTYIFNQNPKPEAKIGSFCPLNRKIEKIDDFSVENIFSKFSIIYMISIHPLLWASGRGFCPLAQKRNSGVLCTLEHAKYEATVLKVNRNG